MNKKLSLAVVIVLSSVFACQTEDDRPTSKNEISAEALTSISQLGFSTHDVKRMEDGSYLVEGDIILHENDLSAGEQRSLLQVASTEQYRTTNLVSAPRLITVSVASTLGTAYVQAVDAAIARYNAENLSLTFQRVASGGNIQVVKAGILEQFTFLASSGFPTADGKPYNQIKVSTYQMNSQPLDTKASIIAHEMGHAIGFRHTDYMDRSYSCGGSATNEGASDVGAINIPGTPTGADPNSWMLACIGSGQNRPFNANDKIALDYLY